MTERRNSGINNTGAYWRSVTSAGECRAPRPTPFPDVAEQHTVLRRRLAFLEAPASFVYDGDRPLRAEEVTDPYRRGLLLTARATSRAERAWLREVLGEEPPTYS